MSKKLILFLMVLLFGSTSFLRADEVTIGDPTSTTTNSYLPTYSLYNYAFSQQIYTADEIGMGGTINEFTMWLKNSSSYARNLNVYMKEVSEATFESGSAWVSMTESDLVATGTLASGITTPVATTFTLTTPFNYSGENNLVICFQDVTGSWSSGAASVVMTGNGNQAIYAYRDASLYDPTTPGVTGTTLSNKSVVMLDITPSSTPGPTPTPTGDLSITPATWNLGIRPTNGWMEPFAVRILNEGAPAIVQGTMSNTSGVTPFTVSEEIDQTLGTDEAIDFEVLYSVNGTYAEEFTLFYVETRDIITVPVTGTFYTADWGDIVETAEPIALSYSNGEATIDETVNDLQANYMLHGMTEMKNDAVFVLNLGKDADVVLNTDENTDKIFVYKKVNDFHPTAAVEPVAVDENGAVNTTLLAGQYYVVVAGQLNTVHIQGSVSQRPAPTDITNVGPDNGATGLEGNIVLEWQGGLNATEYQVLFGTSPTSLTVAMDWTMVDDNYGTFDVTNLVAPTTQYFWQIKARNSNGTVAGPRWGFTTALIAPNTVTATEEEIFTDGSTTIKWKLAGGGGFSGEITVADGTTTNSYVPVYGLWADYYTRSEMIYPAEMIEEMTGGEITSLTFYLSSPATATWAPDVFQVYFQEVDATTLSTYYTAANAQICYTGYLDGTGTTMTIVLDDPYQYQGGNLLVGIQETVNGTYKSASFYGISATGASASGYNSSALASVTFNQRNFLPKVTFTCGGKGVANNRGLLGFNLYYQNGNEAPVKVNNALIAERQYTLNGVLPYNLDEGNAVTVTAVYDEGESEMSDAVMVHVSGYGTLTGTVTELISGQPVAGVNVKFVGKDEFDNNATFEANTNANGVYTINNVKAGNYTGTARLEGMEPVQNPVVLAYNTTETVNFVIHEVYNPVMSVVAEEMDPTMSRVKWSMTEVLQAPAFPTPGGNNGGGNTGGGTTVSDQTFNFDASTMEGWTTIDANNDGYDWVLGSNIGGVYLVAGASLAGTGHNASNDMVCSGSYSNYTGSAITPDNYLVAPTKAAWTSISFFACAQDASYAAEHYGVAVSTTGNTSAADFTMVQEWTMTAKDAGAMSIGRNGETRAQGSWYEKTVDLSAYAGQDIWVAIRHFNCNDQFILNVDDITLHGNAKGGRDVQEYRLYRVADLTENGEPVYVEEIENVTPYYITTVTGMTQYADFAWEDMEPGLYQYGVSAVYPSPAKGGTRDEVIIGTGTATNSYVPTYNLYNYSCTNQLYTAEEIGGAGTINSIAFMPATVNAASRNINVYMVNTEKTSFTSGTDWIPVTDADLVYSGTVAWTANTWSTIELTTPFDFDGTNLCVVVNDLTGSWTSSNQYYVSDATSQAIRIYQDSAPYNPAAPGSGTVLNVKNNIKLDITFGGSGNDDPVTPVVWSNILPRDIQTTVNVNAVVPVGTAEGTVVTFHNTYLNTNFVITLDSTGTAVIDDFIKGEYLVTVDLQGYTCNEYVNTPMSIWHETTINAEFEEVFKPVETVNASRTGYVTWDEIVPVNRIAERYMVKLNNTTVAEQVENYIQLQGLTVGTTYTVEVAVVYSTGMSIFKSAQFTFADCNSAAHQVDTLVATNVLNNTNVTLAWDGETPNPNPNPNPNPGTGASYDFDDGTMMGWTSLDANNDGYGWVAGNAVGGVYLVAGASLAGSGHNASEGLVCSGSYSNYTGAAITPDNYLVSPAKGEYTSVSFWACGQDASYVAEHFGVAVSTTSNTSGSAFETVQEWTMTAKGEGQPTSVTRSGNRVQGSWHEYTVDLSAYAGQEIWVAIRHFGCSDMFILDVDDIELTAPAKELAAGTMASAGTGFGMINNGMTKDGNWYYYDNGTNNDAIGLTSGGSFYWGIMFPAGTYEGNRLTKIAYFDYTAHTGNVIIYQGGTSAPGTQLYTQPYSVSGTEQYIEIEMDEAVELDDTQNVWVVMHNNNGQYVAAIDGSTGVNYGSCLSTDGSTWYTMVNQAASSLDGNWNLRAYIESGSGPAPSGLVANKYNIFFDGELVGATASKTFTYDAGDFNSHEYTVIWVDSDYLESCIVDGVNKINYAATNNQSIDENEVVNALYPNPTSGDLHINATAMTHISIVNAMGQMVYEQDVNADEMVINMAQFETGVYMVNIITENGSSVKRVTVVK